MLEFARVYAHATYKNHVLYRSWNAQRGGVYVFIDSLNKPNKYLKDFPDRDLAYYVCKLSKHVAFCFC